MENENNVLTKKEFKEIFFGEMDKMAMMIQKGFDGVTHDIEALDQRVTALEIHLSKFEKYVEDCFDTTTQELKDIRKQIKQADTRAEVVDLELRVGKIEKKLGLKA